jgi:hypothetical protein
MKNPHESVQRTVQCTLSKSHVVETFHPGTQMENSTMMHLKEISNCLGSSIHFMLLFKCQLNNVHSKIQNIDIIDLLIS